MKPQHRVTRAWLEMHDLERPRTAYGTWVPLRASASIEEHGELFEPGHVREYAGVIGVLVPSSAKVAALQVQWGDAGVASDRPYIDGTEYFPAGTFAHHEPKLRGEYLVLKQDFANGSVPDWHLHQDLQLGLNLQRRGDVWTRPEEDDEEVARLSRDERGRPMSVEIRSEHLRDYLCARRSGLLLVTFRERRAVLASKPGLRWREPTPEREFGGGTWRGTLRPILRNGMPYGSEAVVLRIARVDVDARDEVPDLPPPGNANVAVERRVLKPRGEKLYYVDGALFRNEWVEAARSSPRVRGDAPEKEYSYLVDTVGTTVGARELREAIRWLWFRPEIVRVFLENPKNRLRWLSRNTAVLTLAARYDVHFGINGLGYVNVFAKDIALLPEQMQRRWHAANIVPNGAVCEELVAVQMKCIRPSTTAPEGELAGALERLKKVSLERLGGSIVREHRDEADLIRKIHRFAGHSLDGICALAKDITRLVADRLDQELMSRHTTKEDPEWKSLRHLEALMTALGENGAAIVGPLKGINGLRISDAHPSSSNLAKHWKAIGVEVPDNYRGVAEELIRAAASAVARIALVIAQASLLSRHADAMRRHSHLDKRRVRQETAPTRTAAEQRPDQARTGETARVRRSRSGERKTVTRRDGGAARRAATASRPHR